MQLSLNKATALFSQLFSNKLNNITDTPNQLALCYIANDEQTNVMLEYPKKIAFSCLPFHKQKKLISFVKIILHLKS